MKKNSFIEGTIVATLGILIVKIIGVIYVIPFNAIIGFYISVGGDSMGLKRNIPLFVRLTETEKSKVWDYAYKHNISANETIVRLINILDKLEIDYSNSKEDK